VLQVVQPAQKLSGAKRHGKHDAWAGPGNVVIPSAPEAQADSGNNVLLPVA
jgi:hypothetical protein